MKTLRLVGPKRASVLVVDDDSIVVSWLRMAFADTEFRFVGSAATGAEARRMIGRHAPDVVLVDDGVRGMDPLDLIRELAGLGVSARFILMATGRRPGLNEAARRAGAHGTVLKTGDVDELVSVLRAVAAGDRSFDSRLARAANGGPALSPRERQVLALVAAGKTNREIARELGVGVETVKTILRRTFTKLQVRRRAHAVAAAHGQKLL